MPRAESLDKFSCFVLRYSRLETDMKIENREIFSLRAMEGLGPVKSQQPPVNSGTVLNPTVLAGRWDALTNLLASPSMGGANFIAKKSKKIV